MIGNVMVVPGGATYTYMLRPQEHPYGVLRWDLDEPITGPCLIVMPTSEPGDAVEVGVYDRETYALVRRVWMRRSFK